MCVYLVISNALLLLSPPVCASFFSPLNRKISTQCKAKSHSKSRFTYYLLLSHVIEPSNYTNPADVYIRWLDKFMADFFLNSEVYQHRDWLMAIINKKVETFSRAYNHCQYSFLLPYLLHPKMHSLPILSMYAFFITSYSQVVIHSTFLHIFITRF